MKTVALGAVVLLTGPLFLLYTIAAVVYLVLGDPVGVIVSAAIAGVCFLPCYFACKALVKPKRSYEANEIITVDGTVYRKVAS